MFKIGNVKVYGKAIQAPMAGVSNKIFRKFSEKFGAAVTWTEMTSNVGLKYNSEKTMEYADIDKTGVPTALQIFGGEVEDYINAAKFFDENSNADFIDINMGCPVNKVAIKSEAGSALVKTPEKIEKIIKGIVAVIKKPLTIKIRIGWDENDLTYLEVAKIAEKAGAAAISVHGRTRKQMYTGKANWQAIKEIKDAVSIPVIGNGDVNTPEDAKKMLDETGVDAVMIARAARSKPWIFKQINQYLKTGKYDPDPSIDEVITLLNEYYEELKKLKGEKNALLQLRGIATHWLDSFKGAKPEKQLIVQQDSKEKMFIAIENFKQAHLKWKRKHVD
ncbi:MAG: tRNA dihydrouridine synthase DusB [Mycoplasmatales bacterium]|nr:tRNA dihydrouridine synthase DusB [Mycoplasmatales bacterium]